ncbi:MAG TPA: hypothetical protein VF721_15630 [Pyrinomonadaceae bacterium]
MNKFTTTGNIVLLCIAVFLTSALNNSCKTDSNVQNQIVKDNKSPAKSHEVSSLQSSKVEHLPHDVTVWANNHFSAKEETTSNTSQENDTDLIILPAMPLVFEKIIEFEVIPIPKNRRIAGYEEMESPSFHAIVLLRDKQKDLYQAVIESFDNKTFSVQSIGPLLDNRTEKLNLPLRKRKLKACPPSHLTKIKVKNSQESLTYQNGKPVLIPYPYSMNQIFYQFGDDRSTALFQSIHTGRIYQNFGEVLDEAEANWKRFNSALSH